MKKTLIALATLSSLAGVAHAQSSVTLFTLLDANVSQYSAGAKSGASDDTTLNDGTVNGLNGSRLGFRATEDLGGGLKAAVLLEGGLLLNSGSLAQGGRAWGRQIFVSLAHSDAGEVRLGRQYILSDSVLGQTNPFGNALTLNPGTGVSNKGKSLPFFLNAPRADNAITVFSPNFSGFQASAQLALDTAGTSDRFHGLKLAYTAGALNTALSHEWNRSRTTGDRVNQSTTVAANYNFGSFKLLGGLQRNRDLVTTSPNGAFTGTNLLVQADTSLTADRTDGYTVGVEVPMGSWLYGANFSNVKYGSAAGASLNLTKLAVGARYGLSKNTFLYASASQAGGDLQAYISAERVLQVGLRTAF